jgi:hypothetical protein
VALGACPPTFEVVLEVKVYIAIPIAKMDKNAARPITNDRITGNTLAYIALLGKQAKTIWP